jgi:hypothetical protein
VSYKFNPFTGTFDDVGPNNGNGVPGGSTTQVQFNDGGVFGGVANSSVDNATGNITLGSRFISSLNGAASAPPGIFTGTWFTGGTATTTKPQVLIEPTGATSTAWSTSGTGLGVNAASGFAGQLLDLQLNGTSNFNVNSTGRVSVPLGTAALPSIYPGTDTNTGIYSPGANQVAVATNGAGRLFVDASGTVSVVGASTSSTNFTANGRTSLSSSANWNFSGLLLRRTDSNTAIAKQISFLLDGDTDNDTALTSCLNLWGTYSSAPTTGSTSTGLSASLNLGAPNAIIAHTNGGERLRITSAGVLQVADAGNITVGTTTGTKIGTATTQKLGFWDKTPVVQPTTGISGATFVADSGGSIHPTSTFDGYTIAQVVAALRQLGILA